MCPVWFKLLKVTVWFLNLAVWTNIELRRTEYKFSQILLFSFFPFGQFLITVGPTTELIALFILGKQYVSNFNA